MNLERNNQAFALAEAHEYRLVYAKNKEKPIFYEFSVDVEDVLKDLQKYHLSFYKKGASMHYATGADDKREHRSEFLSIKT